MNKKSFILLLAFFLSAGMLSAQDTIKGTVIDRRKNPVAGTRITLKDGSAVTMTDFDGAFEIEAASGDKATASCIGLQDKTFRLKDDMVIKLKNTNSWNHKPSHYSPFFVLQYGSVSHHWTTNGVGIMGGMVKNIGWYGKVFISNDDISGKARAEIDATSDWKENNGKEYWTTGNMAIGHRQLTAGGVVRLGCPLHFCLGVGVCNYSLCAELVPDISGNTHYVKAEEEICGIWDATLMMAFRHFIMDFSVSSPFNLGSGTISLGLGYRF